MPAVSKAQFKKMFALYEEGKITKKQLDDFTKGVDYKSLPKKKGKNANRKKSNQKNTRKSTANKGR